MQSDTQSPPASKRMLWAGWIMTAPSPVDATILEVVDELGIFIEDACGSKRTHRDASSYSQPM